MNQKIETTFDYINSLSESDLDQIISFVVGIVSAKQRFLCKGCLQTFMHTTNTLMANFHYGLSV